MRMFAIRYPATVLLVAAGLLAADVACARTIEVDRRVEEEKRQELQPTTPAPVTPAYRPAGAGPGKAPAPPAFEALYFARLATQRLAFHYDALKCLTILTGVDEEQIDLASQVVYAGKQGWIPPRLRAAYDPTAPLRKGEAAYMFQRVLGVRGGLAWHLFGPTERYALKELVFQGFLSPGLVTDLVSGDELVQLMNQAVRYRLQHQRPAAP